MTGLPGNRMRDRKALIPDLEQMVFYYVVSNNLLGGSVTDASITHAAKDAYKAMQEAGRISLTSSICREICTSEQSDVWTKSCCKSVFDEAGLAEA